MSTELKVSKELKECLDTMCSIIHDLTRILNVLIAVTMEHESVAGISPEKAPIPNQVKPVLAVLLQAIGSSSHTVLKLSDAPGLHTRDCFSIARSIVETAVNVCYIIAEGEPASERAIKHAQQKAYKDLDRVSEISGKVIRLQYSGRLDPSNTQELDEQVKEFTSRSGREKGWSDLSIDERIEAVGEKFGSSVLLPLHTSRFAIYRHSSEILHGTYFGALFFSGLTKPSTGTPNFESLSETVADHHMIILFSLILSISAVIECSHLAYGFSAAHARSRALFQTLTKLDYFNPKQNFKEDEQKPDHT